MIRALERWFLYIYTSLERWFLYIYTSLERWFLYIYTSLERWFLYIYTYLERWFLYIYTSLERWFLFRSQGFSAASLPFLFSFDQGIRGWWNTHVNLRFMAKASVKRGWELMRVERELSLAFDFNRPFPFWVKFWSRQVWTKILSQLERASQN
jgi:hypothetical protein